MKRKMFLSMMTASLFALGCSSDDSKSDSTPDPNYDIIVGKWRSPEVAFILKNFADSIHAEFRNNQTYVVKSYKDGTATELTGTYETQEGSGTIRKITLNQSTPTVLTSAGIYEVDNDGKMTYEVAQTEPVQAGVTPPTPEGGFGSTSGGSFGDMNIQTYYKMN